MILCCGEALIDMIPEPTGSGQHGYVPHCGGAIYNTAIALGRLGLSTGMLTGLSNDLFGQQLTRGLRESHVATRLIIKSDRPTTLAFVQLNNGQATYQFFDENSAGRMLSAADFPALPDAISALYFGGISLACEPAAEAYLTFAQRHAATRAIMLDPNIRAGFISDEPRYRARLAKMVALSDVLKVSDEDLDWIDPSTGSTEAKARALMTAGPSAVIVTRGREGALGFLKTGETAEAPAQAVQVVDTVGAGDTFNAGIMANLSENGLLTKDALSELTVDALHQALGFAAKVAAVTVSRAGANPPWAYEMEKEPA